MKISKLFHWLYGILMLLPILVFIPNAFYYGFNEQAIAQTKTEQVPVYYESNEVTSVNDIMVGNIYYYNNNMPYISVQYLTKIMDIDIDLFKLQFPQYQDLNITICFLGIQQNGATVVRIDNESINFVSQPMQIIPKGNLNNTLLDNYIGHIVKTDYKYIKDYLPLTTNMSITDSMSYAWDSVWQNDLFSWSYESFLAEPFKYIGNVFGLPNDNAIYYCLSYWLDISIIWLCFDLIMYVPLLVHRWIDKGVLE